MVRIPRPEPLFAEPNHLPEFEAQHVYEAARDGWAHAYEGVDDRAELLLEPNVEPRPPLQGAPGVYQPRAGVYQPTLGVYQPEGHSPLCVVPSHQVWAVEKFGEPRDYRNGEGCVFR